MKSAYMRLIDSQDEIARLLNHDASYKDMPKCLSIAEQKLPEQALRIRAALEDGLITSYEWDVLNYCYRLSVAKHKYLKETEKIEREWREKHEKDNRANT